MISQNYLIIVSLRPMSCKNVKIHERRNQRVYTAFNLVFKNQLDKFIPPGY